MSDITLIPQITKEKFRKILTVRIDFENASESEMKEVVEWLMSCDLSQHYWAINLAKFISMGEYYKE